VRRHVFHRKIVGKKEIFERPNGQGDEREDGHARVVRTLRQQSAARDDSDDSRAESIHGCEECQQQRERAEDIHYIFSMERRLGLRLSVEFKLELNLGLKIDIKTDNYLDLVSAFSVPAGRII
jgi:hypothetical protein